MNGLSLSREYWRCACLPIVQQEMPEILEHIAVGLAGEGSECFGWDDELSQDHAWGPRLLFWMTPEDAEQLREPLEQLCRRFPRQFAGIPVPEFSLQERTRAGIWTIPQFCEQMIGLPHVPETTEEWLCMEESGLACLCSGEIFLDGPGIFTALRRTLQAHYPKDIRLYRLACCAASAAQTGQYNMPRCYLRGESVAAGLAKARFLEQVIHMTFLLNRQWQPFYKWAFHGMCSLPALGGELTPLMEQLMGERLRTPSAALADRIAVLLIGEMQRQELTASDSDFLLDHCAQLMKRIEDRDLAERPISMR